MTKTSHIIGAALIVAAFTSNVNAGQNTVKTSATAASNTNLTGSLETSWVSNYVYQGAKLDSNPVFIPKLALQYSLFEGGTLQATAQQVVGTQGSTWFRSQYNVGFALDLGRFTLTPGYQITSWPGRDGNNSQGFNGRLTFNDEGLTPVALNPHVYVSSEADPRGATPRGTYYEAGVTPSVTQGNLTASLPVTVGAGARGYYNTTDNGLNYGFASVGVNFVYTVTPGLALKAGATYYNTDSKVNATSNFVTTTVGVAASF